jgi:hypothetical protein
VNRRGVSLLWVLALSALLFTLGLATAVRIDQARQLARAAADGLRARSQAASGCRYARARLASRSWKGDESFQSPQADGFFSLQLVPMGGGRVSIHCLGRSGRIEVRQVETYP